MEEKNRSELVVNCEKGLTLVEVIAVIILIGLVGGVLFKGIFAQSETAKAQTNVVKMQKLKSALSSYKLQFNKYPSSLQGLVKPSAETKKNGGLFTPFADEADLSDLWGTPYKYQVKGGGRSFSLTSLGADAAPGGEGADQDVTIP